MSEFASWSPDAPRGARLGAAEGLVIRSARRGDVAELAAIAAAREGQPVERWLASFERMLDEPERVDGAAGLLAVAELDGRLLGYGKATHFTPPADAPPQVAPEGWYLSGVVVRPEFRRRGVGQALTRARLDWIARRSERAYYFVNARNQVSLELHRRLGFIELRRDFVHPQARFEGGAGVLCACDLGAARRV